MTGTQGGLCVLWVLQRTSSTLSITTSNADENSNKKILANVHQIDDSQESYRAEPFAVLHGHESTVTGLTECVFDHAPSVCSVSVDGSLCVWNLSDGRCMAVSPFILSGSPTSIVSLPGGMQVACAGKHNNIEIVDLRQLKVVRTLDAHSEWVTSLSCGPITENNDLKTIMLSVSEDSTLRYWMFEKNRDKIEWDQMPAYSVDAKTMRPLTVAHADDWTYILVVCEEKWMMFSYQAVEPLFEIAAPEGKKLKGGLFIDLSHLLIYTQDGDGFVYRLPKQGVSAKIEQQAKEAEIKEKQRKEAENKRKTVEHRAESPLVKTGSSTSLRKSTTQQFNTGQETQLKEAAESLKEAQQQIVNFGNQLLGAFQMLAPKKKVDIPAPKLETPGSFKKSKSMPTSLSTGEGELIQKVSSVTVEKHEFLVTPSVSNSSSSTSLAEEKGKSILKTPSVESRISQFQSTSVEAALEQALNSKITNQSKPSFKISPARQVEQPDLIECLREEESVKASLGTSVWISQGGFVLRADSSGHLKIWKIDIAKKTETATTTSGHSEISISVQRQVKIQEVTTSTLASGWPRNEFPNNKITASQFALDTKDRSSKLIHGYIDGHIAVLPSISCEQAMVFKAHNAKVTSLLVLNDDDNDRSILISGSADYSVKLWDLSNGKLMKTFHFHSGAVNLIFTPPKSIRKRLQNCFCTVAEDRSVILYSLKTLECIHILGGHSSSVVAVYWRVDLDYLLVRCSDGSVYIWQLSTGLLERRVFGKIAAELIERSEGPGSCRRPTVKINFSKQSAFTEQARGFLESLSLTVSDTEPDLQLLMLSVRRLVGYINSKKELIRESIQKGKESNIPHSLLSAVAYVLQYGKHASLQALRTKLGIQLTQPTPYIGLKGAGSTFSLIVPKASEKSHPFIFSPVLSALHTISAVAVLNCLASVPELKKLCHEVAHYYLHEMPKDFDRYEDPSFLWCAQFLKDSAKEIQNAAKAVMGAVLQRMDLVQLKSLAEKLTSNLTPSQNDSNSTRKQNVIVALAVLAYKIPDAVDNRTKGAIAMGLIEIMEQGGPQNTTAITLLGDGFSVWQYYIPDSASFCRKLFQLSLPALTTSDPKNFIDSVSTDALQAFVNMAAVDTRLYIELINGIILNSQQTSPTTLSAAITSVYPLMHKHSSCLVDHLVVITSLLLKVLDPHFPAIRDVCMPASTNILRYLVEIYPMVSFHQEKQKLAVGNNEGIVVIYDMRTAAKWQLFEAHKAPVAALQFSLNGEMLVSYCPKDGTARVWNIDGSGVLNLLGVASRSIKSFEVPGTKIVIKNDDILKFVKVEWDSNKMFSLRPGKNMNKITFSL